MYKKNIVNSFYLFTLFALLFSCKKEVTPTYDIAVYGGTSAGIMAAYTAKMQGKSVALIEPTSHLGGLTTGGLGQTDIGNKYAITGLSRDFYRRVGVHYGKLEQWTFEPHVTKNIFLQYLKKADISVIYNNQLVSVQKVGETISSITLKATESNGSEQIIKASVFIDATYEGDLMAKAGVSYTLGREANAQYGETWNGVQLLDKHQFPENIDPYKVKGDKTSGLLWGISSETLAPVGSGDKKMQAYNFRLCLTDSLENQVPITRPNGYDSTKFELLLRYIEAKKPSELNWALMHIQPMPNRKTDINNSGPFSTDMIGENYTYSEANYEEREAIVEKHKVYTQSLLYFLGNDPRVPEHLRTEMKQWGYPKDEYTTTGNFSPQLYVREARRMIGDYVMTEKHCIGENIVEDGIGMAAYTMDSHNTQRLVVNGMVKNEGDVQQGTPNPFPISYRSIIPKKTECTNLLVPVCLSASHIAFGSIRMEPVFMVLGQTAGLAAAMAVESGKGVQAVDIKALQKSLKENPLSDNSTVEILIDNTDLNQVQLIGNWQVDSTARGRYGRNYLVSKSKESAVIFAPKFTDSGNYEVFIYIPPTEGLALNYTIEVATESEKKMIELVTKPGTNDWASIGVFDINAKRSNSVKIYPKDGSSAVIVDAVLFLPKNQK